MQLFAFSHVLRERWKIASAVVLAFVAIALLLTALTPKSYTAQAQVLVTARSTGSAATQAQANNYVQTQVTGYATLIDSPSVVSYVTHRLHPQLSNQQIRDALAASAVAGQSLVDITATDTSAGRSANLATLAALGFQQTIQRYDSSTRLFVTARATTPGSPTSPRPALNIVLGLLVGLVLGAAAAWVRHGLDRRIREPEVIARAAGAPLVGVILEDSSASRQPIASSDEQHPGRIESFRQLRAAVQHATEDNVRIVAICGPVRGVGTTSVAINLAVALAETDTTVCLVDAQLRQPAITPAFGLHDGPGLSDVLVRHLPVHNVRQAAGAGLHVVPAGSPLPSATALLGSQAMAQALRALAQDAEYVIIDAGPLLSVADGAALAAVADATIVVARYGSTTEAEVFDAVEALRRVGRSVSGVVLNRTPPRRGPTSRGRRRRGYAIVEDLPADASRSAAGRHTALEGRRGPGRRPTPAGRTKQGFST